MIKLRNIDKYIDSRFKETDIHPQGIDIDVQQELSVPSWAQQVRQSQTLANIIDALDEPSAGSITSSMSPCIR